MVEKNTSCAKKRVVVRAPWAPVACPPEEDTLWNGHPRVYLPLHERKECKCPYCGTVYVREEAL